MAEDNQQEKSEEATPQRREDFRKQGQVAQTRELASALILLAVSLLTWFAGRFFVQQIFDTYNIIYKTKLLEVLESGDVVPALSFAFGKIMLFVVPFLIIVFVASVGASVLQIGFLFTSEPLTPNLNKINPLEGFKRIFSLKAAIEGVKTIVKFCLVGLVVYLVLEKELVTIPKLIYWGPMQIFAFITTMLFKTTTSIAALMLVLASFDYLFQRFDMEKQMRMTKQEVKDETKQREGDPLVKARIRKVQREIATRRMMEDVPKADVIITNPTHIAVAVKYQPEKFAAPVLLAKGTDYIAEKIKERAREFGIPIVENKPLARIIFKTLEIGQQIPRELFAAVAEVLAYVFKLKKKRKKSLLNG